MQIPDKLKHYINGPHGMNMGTRGADLKPEYARVLGARTVDDQHIHVYFDKKTCGRTLKNFEDNGQVVVVMAKLENFESYQFKGKSVRWQESTAEELQEVEDYFKNFNEGLIKLGFADGAVYNYPHSSMLTLLMKVEEIYEQTPKAGTGKKSNCIIMPIITDDLKASMQGIVPSTLVSCSKEGIPNINYISQVYYVDEEHVALSHQFFSKSILNIDENPQVTVNIVHPESLKLWKLELLFSHKKTDGELFEQMCYQLEAIASMTGMEGVFRLLSAYVFKVLHIEDIS